MALCMMGQHRRRRGAMRLVPSVCVRQFDKSRGSDASWKSAALGQYTKQSPYTPQHHIYATTPPPPPGKHCAWLPHNKNNHHHPPRFDRRPEPTDSRILPPRGAAQIFFFESQKHARAFASRIKFFIILIYFFVIRCARDTWCAEKDILSPLRIIKVDTQEIIFF